MIRQKKVSKKYTKDLILEYLGREGVQGIKHAKHIKNTKVVLGRLLIYY